MGRYSDQDANIGKNGPAVAGLPGGDIEMNALAETSDVPPNTETETPIQQGNEITGTRLLLIHISICLCTLLVGFDTTILATAVPVITSHFNSINDVGWYGGASYLTLRAAQPLAGRIYTMFPIKVVYLIYVAVFELGSLVSALSPISKALIIGRALAGVGASGLFGGGLVIITTIIPLHRRAIWQGTWSSVFSVSSIVGPLLGGALTEHLTWRWCFYINLPIGGAAALFFFFTYHDNREINRETTLIHRLKTLDWIGTFLFAGFILMLLLALQRGGIRFSWKLSTIIGLFVGSGVSACLFLIWQIQCGDAALIPPKLFANRNAILICAGIFFVNGPFQTIVYWLPVWFQGVLGVTPVQSSVRYLATVISDVLSAIISAGIVTKSGCWNPFILLGAATMSLSGGLFSTIYPQIASGHWIGYQILTGNGYALATNMVEYSPRAVSVEELHINHEVRAQLGMQASLPQELVPIGATTVLTVICASCAIFLAIGQTIFQDRLASNLPTYIPPEVRARLVRSIGATDIRSAVSPSELPAVLATYSKSITQVWYLPAAAPVIAFIFFLCCRWTSLKNGVADFKKNEDAGKGPNALKTA